MDIGYLLAIGGLVGVAAIALGSGGRRAAGGGDDEQHGAGFYHDRFEAQRHGAGIVDQDDPDDGFRHYQ